MTTRAVVAAVVSGVVLSLLGAAPAHARVWTHPQAVVVDGEKEFSADPHLSLNSRGVTVVTWACSERRRGELYTGICLRRRTPQGALTRPVVVAAPSRDAHYSAPQAVVDEAGIATVLLDPHEGPLTALRVTPGGEVGEPVVLDAGPTKRITAAVNQAGDVVVAWRPDVRPEVQFRTRVLHADGSLGPVGLVGTKSPRIAARPDGAFMLLGAGEPSGDDRIGSLALVRVVDGVAGALESVTDRPTQSNDLAVLSDGTTVVVWQQQEPAGRRSYIRRFPVDASGGTVRPIVAARSGFDIELRTLGDGRLFVRWYRAGWTWVGVVPRSPGRAVSATRVIEAYSLMEAARDRLIFFTEPLDRDGHRVTVRSWNGSGKLSKPRYLLVDRTWRIGPGYFELASASAGGHVALVNVRGMRYTHKQPAYRRMELVYRH